METQERHSRSEHLKADPTLALPAQLSPHVVIAIDTSSNLDRFKIRTAPDGNRALNEYLVSELELFASVMLDQRVPTEAHRINRAAHTTTLQLYYDHTRALRDFDAEWKRWVWHYLLLPGALNRAVELNY